MQDYILRCMGDKREEMQELKNGNHTLSQVQVDAAFL